MKLENAMLKCINDYKKKIEEISQILNSNIAPFHMDAALWSSTKKLNSIYEFMRDTSVKKQLQDVMNGNNVIS